MKPPSRGAGLMAALFWAASLALPLVGQVSTDAESPVIGIGRRHSVISSVLGEKVDLVVHLPAEYSSGQKRYPIIVFLGSEYRAKFALAAAALDYMTAQGQIPAIVLIGVDLPHGNFAQVPQENAAGTASADRHIAALKEEIIPFVDRTFRTNGYSILYGGSNSGVFAVYALLSGKLPFQAYFASSPMLGWCPNLLSEKARLAFADFSRPSRFLFLIWSDDDIGGVTREMPKFADLLAKCGPSWLRWQLETRHNEGHVPEMDFPLGLRALFPDYNPRIERMTLRSLQEHFATLSSRYGFSIEVPEALLFDAGMALANRQQLDDAQKTFEFAVAQYPRNPQMHAGLGFVFKQRGNSDVAIEHLKKALEIDPGQSWAKQQLAELKTPRKRSGERTD
jgi:hypothetical protein